ncbi:hypothetical protein BDQ12DRAFT_684556 [Crucibulum laeve]|uniref:Uncharacterized protein n=1 Tax=Crucibulum laeve TaxID=68775 RepID=A0A5C3LZB8_9AGAR|nr:hypothetical protein BDQ12DRAFT_684556 [Crucibulum laeve]
MDQDLAQRPKKSKKHCDSAPHKLTQSKFFGTSASAMRPARDSRRHSLDNPFAPGPSRSQEEKENAYIVIDDSDGDDLGPIVQPDIEVEDLEPDRSDLSMAANCSGDLDMDLEEPPDAVEQEDGYISPTPSRSRDTDDLSSPPSAARRTRVKKEPGLRGIESDDDFGADALSSPMSAVKIRRSNSPPSRRAASITPTKNSQGARRILVHETPGQFSRDIENIQFPGPDLRDFDLTSEIDVFEDEIPDGSGSTAPPTPSPETPLDQQADPTGFIDVGDFTNPEEDHATRTKVVMEGWREKWALGGKGLSRAPEKKPSPTNRASAIRRSETNVTQNGRHSIARASPQSVPTKHNAFRPLMPLKPRRSLVFFHTVETRKVSRTVEEVSDNEERMEAEASLVSVRA